MPLARAPRYRPARALLADDEDVGVDALRLRGAARPLWRSSAASMLAMLGLRTQLLRYDFCTCLPLLLVLDDAGAKSWLPTGHHWLGRVPTPASTLHDDRGRHAPRASRRVSAPHRDSAVSVHYTATHMQRSTAEAQIAQTVPRKKSTLRVYTVYTRITVDTIIQIYEIILRISIRNYEHSLAAK